MKEKQMTFIEQNCVKKAYIRKDLYHLQTYLLNEEVKWKYK